MMRVDTSKGTRFSKLHLLQLKCKEPIAHTRVKFLMDLIELEWQVACQKDPRRLWLEVGPHFARTHR